MIAEMSTGEALASFSDSDHIRAERDHLKAELEQAQSALKAHIAYWIHIYHCPLCRCGLDCQKEIEHFENAKQATIAVFPGAAIAFAEPAEEN